MPQTFLTQVQTILDEVGGAVFWPTAQIWDAANSVLVEVYPRCAHKDVMTSVVFDGSTRFVSLPTNYIMIPQYWVGTEGKLFATTYAKLEQWSQQWQGATPAYPKHFVVFDESRVEPFPHPDVSYSFDLWGTPWPTELTDANPEPAEDQTFVQALAHLTAGRLLEHTFPLVGDLQEKEGEEVLQRYIVNVRNQQSHRIRRLRPGTAFTNAQSGSIRIGQNLLSTKRPYLV